MSQNTPRKFSEKIAMMMRKQNEDQDAYASIMNEVRVLTKKPPNSPGSSDGSPVGGPPDMNMIHMPSNYLPGQQSHMLIPGPPHPMNSWGRPGGSLPNVHQMAQSAPDMYYNGWGQWPAQPMQPSHPQQAHSYAQTHRTRSPGAQHYHPYRKSNERLPQNDASLLQLPDPSWSNRAKSDPTIHMNTVNPNYYYNGQQWSPDMLTNGQNPQHQQQQQLQANMYQAQPQAPAMAPPPHMGYPATQYQQSMGTYQDNPQRMQQPLNDMPIGSLPSAYMMQQTPPSSSTASPPGPMSVGPSPFTHQQQQQLSTPAAVSESQSAPTSPAQSYDAPRRQWPPTRHYSASPDTMEIPNIVLTDPNGALDCFAGLQLDSDDMRQLMADQSPLDPACETQLLN